jgi:acetyltransferase-like isoleucine patch superfamily enzyme
MIRLRRLTYGLAWALALLALLPALAVHRLRFLPAYGRFVAVSCLLALVPGFSGLILRRVWYRCTLARCGRNLGVDWMAVLRDERSEVGDNVWIGSGSWVGWCTLHDDVVTGDHVSILSGPHQHRTDRLDMPMRLQHGEKVHIEIGPDVWIGSQVAIMASVGRGCVVAAGAVVVAPTEPLSIVGGVPARVLRTRDARPA